MTQADFLAGFSKDEQVASVVDWLGQTEDGSLLWKQIAGSLKAILAQKVFEHADEHHLFVFSDKEEAAYFYNDLEAVGNPNHLFFFPGTYRRPYQIEETDNANVMLRTEVLNKLMQRARPAIIVTYADGIFEKVVTRKTLVKHTIKLKVGEQVDLDFMVENLFDAKFEHVDFVVEPGQFAVRGGIVDVYSFSNDRPYRIEFMDDEVESIRTFDLTTQQSINAVKHLTLVPNVADRTQLEQRQSFLEFLPQRTVVWYTDEGLIANRLKQQFSKAERHFAEMEAKDGVAPLNPAELFMGPDLFRQILGGFRRIAFGPTAERNFDQVLTRQSSLPPVFNKHFPLLVEHLQKQQAQKFKNLILCAAPKQVERFYAIFEDIGADVSFTPLVMGLQEGFADEHSKISLLTDHQIFERYRKFRLKTGYVKNEAITIKELSGLQVGDYVTHIDHGIGKFGGLQKIDVNGRPQEAIKIVYRDNDVLYVSIHSLHKIAKYNGKEGHVPKVNKLGTGAWAKTKSKTKARVKLVAYDLLKLYAERKAKKGFQFAPDTYLQHELEASFIYEDTPDQIKATLDIKQDMEAEAPMDRLVCGDVGFGKTEVAIRAAFKAAVDGKQVVVLVPTTVLAFQHYRTFKERLADFPVEVDVINRFRTPKEQRNTLDRLAKGEVDILIGTHRIVGKDVKWKDLGLLIIDEEQKFGVSVKDKLKTIKVNIDTLTLSATPIPRTMQFSLMGARDLSVINTPPPNRFPVQTEVRGFNEALIRDAVIYEVSRGGQVFFVHNRIENIHEVAGMIQRLCPDVKVGVGHGQMDGDQLERVMMAFVNGDYDVLVSTTIIESGLDISNANTIIINNAQNFGLSDLHQMRGRVGRSNRKAFCYLIAPPEIALSDDARKRLNALEQFTDLGSGFNIAMRDLEIRGAGDMLGAEQSGFISDMGFDMYQKILQEAMQELKEKEFSEVYKARSDEKVAQRHYVDDTQIDTDLEVLIPDSYINSIAERLEMYRRIDALESEEQLVALQSELRDRFGDHPPQLVDLFNLVRLRWKAQQLGFEKVVLKKEVMIAYFLRNRESAYYQSETFSAILNYLKDHYRTVTMSEKNDRLLMRFPKVSSVAAALAYVEALAPQKVLMR